MRTLALIALSFLIAASRHANATTFVVDDPGEAHDASPGDNVCATAGSVCTLVAALDEANGHSGADIIQLPPGTWIYTATLPTVTTAMTIEPTIGSDPSATVIQSSNTGHPRLFNLTAGGDLTLESLTLENAQTFYGSALQATSASATLTNCVVTNNAATAIYVTSNSSLTLTNSTIANNVSGLTSPGGIWVDFSNLTATNTTFSENTGGLGGVGYLYTASDKTHTLSISGCTFTGNSSTNSGGALYVGSDTVTIDGSTFTNNTSSYSLYAGGAIYTNGQTPGLVITNSTFTDNKATSVRGGYGGAIFVLNQASCRGCTFSGNSATANGGAVFAGANSGAEFDAVDSTFSGNSAFGGGGLATSETMKLASVTITNNTATAAHGATGGNGATGGGGGTNGINIYARNTIVAGNHSGTSPDCDGQIVSQGYDLVGDATNCSVTASAGNQVGTGGSPIDAGLDVLADNSGPTLTHGLLASSPAGEAGDPGGCTDVAGGPLATDQRGQPRSIDGDSDGTARCDIGAFEAPFGTFPTPTTTSSSTTTTTTTSLPTTSSTSSTAPPTTSTTTSTSSTILPTTSTTTSTTHTPTTVAPSTTTTLAGGCTAVPDGPTLASIVCRLQTLLDRVNAEDQLGEFQSKLAATLTAGHDVATQANDFCGSSDSKHAKQRLKQAGKRVMQYAHRLNSHRATKKLDPNVRTDFLAPATPLENDIKSLRGTLQCPDGAAS